MHQLGRAPELVRFRRLGSEVERRSRVVHRGCVYCPARQLLSHCAELSAAINYENGISTLTGIIMLCVRFYLFPAIGRASKKDLTGTYFDSSLVLMITSNNMLRIKFDSLIILKRIL